MVTMEQSINLEEGYLSSEEELDSMRVGEETAATMKSRCSLVNLNLQKSLRKHTLNYSKRSNNEPAATGRVAKSKPNKMMKKWRKRTEAAILHSISEIQDSLAE